MKNICTVQYFRRGCYAAHEEKWGRMVGIEIVSNAG
jgi:hypothetical protein